MGSHVLLSDSDLSADSVTSRAPAPPLRSMVVAPPGLGLGSRGWDAGAGPSRPSRVPAAPPVAVAPAPAGGGWQTQLGRNARRARARALQPQDAAPRGGTRQPRRLLPAARPPQGGNGARIPVALHGCCYNCGEEDHIAAQCSNETRCVRCGGTQHTSRDCKRPRGSSGSPPPRPPAPPVRAARGAGRAAVAPQAPPVPPVADGARSWREVVTSGGSRGRSSDPVDFSAPFTSSTPATSVDAPLPPPPPLDSVDVCYVLPSSGMVQLEVDLDRAVLATVTGTRPEVTPEMAEAAIHEQLGLSSSDFSIRSFEPADFLLLCRDREVRDLLVASGRVSSPRCSLNLAPWSRRVGALLRETPFLADLEIRGIPAHAWSERTAIKLLGDSGLIDAVDPATASRRDMSCFRLSLWTHDVAAIPAVRWLAVPEPGHGDRLVVFDGRRRPRSESPKVLWYQIRFWVSSWLIGGVPGSSDGSPPALGGRGAGSEGGDGADGPDGPARRRRRRRAPRRWRARGRQDQGPAEPVAATGPLVAQLAPSGRWQSMPSAAGPEVDGGELVGRCGGSPSRADAIAAGVDAAVPHGPCASSRVPASVGSACSVAGPLRSRARGDTGSRSPVGPILTSPPLSQRLSTVGSAATAHGDAAESAAFLQ
ncbi:hypothetical protein QYE76_055365 [Lolium multiflorum]|uniref:CCHC-type domain-containing protein n=1 Tax=Lolium multiflorum TaxID=4521 RepID=A0AAD8T0X4_LOLMU|nr:hypothetical protein QYE76_055365 [Lolium multiflorum]